MKPTRLASAMTASVLLLTGAGRVASDNTLPKDVEWYLVNAGRFAPADLTALESGRVIARVEEGSTDSEVIVIAAVRIRTTREQTVAYYGQMVSFVDGKVTLAFGRFSTPPVLADVGTLTLDRDEIDALKSCKPGDCDLKIGGAGIDKIRGAVDWAAPDAAAEAQRAVQQAVVDYVTAYLQRGDDALVTYNDSSKPVSLKDQWRGILANSLYFLEYQPVLRDYLTEYPRASLAGGRDIIYWVKENYGLKPVLSIVHGVVYQPPERADHTTIVQKQIFASHYYDGSLAVATVIGATEAGKPVSYVVYANRSRGDLLRGGFGGLKRKVARDQAQKAAVQTLQTMQTALEKAAGVR